MSVDDANNPTPILIDTGLPALNPPNGIDDSPSAYSIVGPDYGQIHDAAANYTTTPLYASGMYPTQDNAYTTYDPASREAGEISIPEIWYRDWTGKQAILPSVTQPVRIQHLLAGVYYDLVIDPIQRTFTQYQMQGTPPTGTALATAITSQSWALTDTVSNGPQYYTFASTYRPATRGPGLIPRWLHALHPDSLRSVIAPDTFMVLVLLLLIVVSLVLVSMQPVSLPAPTDTSIPLSFSVKNYIQAQSV
jgi:hypothetical protein